ncbi:putative porin [Gaetbulibacter saemankumensis]|uniref:putative porin n=1 Tax=Gaetbulibacter saemankumensis TaxID=311208 RepID=UPI0004062CB8|nr:putative porin [Gaetbulibacter saemankumensis]
MQIDFYKSTANKQMLFFKLILVVATFFQLGSVFAQGEMRRIEDTSKKSKKNDSINQTKAEDYLIISYEKDTTFVDTALTIKKEYKFNYLRRDDFGLMPFSNLGQTYNSLTYNFQNTKLMPLFGARARHFNYMEVEDMKYFRVPTPFTELFFKTAFEQGQLADSFFTINTSPQVNYSIAYKGLRSLGKYQHILTSTGNFRFTTNYQTKNRRYLARAHIVMQDLMNQENGGLRDESVEYFESGAEEYLDRSILEVQFEDAESILKGKRFHLEHEYKIIDANDSLSHNNLSLGHVISFEDKYFEYSQRSSQDYFGDAFKNSNLKDRATLEHFYNQLQLNYSNNIVGDLQFNISNDNYNYGYNKLVLLNGQLITNRLKGNVYSAGAKYHKKYKGFDLLGDAGLNIAGDFDGNYIKGMASFKLNDDIYANASLNHSSKVPNYNTLLYQSDYVNYNWQNSFDNVKTQQLAFQLKYKKLADLKVDYSTITDYVYFRADEASGQVRPFQNSGTINYLRAKLDNEIKFGKFALNNTILYQNTKDGNQVLNVPEFTTRNTFSFTSYVFKKALFLQTGLTFNYFTNYYMNGYNPVLAEFYVQNDKEYGNFPRFDFFLNAKVRQTRIYLMAEHFNSAFTGYNYYSAPGNPYRDFTIRFGVVWDFFI